MKVHVFHSEQQPKLDGYANVHINELDGVVDNAEVTELIINDTLEYVPNVAVMDYLGIIVKKLRHGGKLIVTGVDAYLVAQDFVQYRIDIEEFNAMLFGGGKPRALALTCHGVVNYLVNTLGLRLVRQSIEQDYHYVVEVQRP